MSIRFTTRVDGDILRVRASGFDESLADVQGYGMAILDACRLSGATRVLCDETALEYRLGTLDTYQAGEFLATHVPAVAKVAIVCNPASLYDAKFFEDVVVNRGLTLRVFTDTETATRWLFGLSSSSDAGA